MEFQNLHQLPRNEVYRCLITEPNKDRSSYPRTHPTKNSSFLRQFQPSWMNKFPWLHYSKHVDGAYCRACVFFASNKASGQNLGQFVTTPFKAWIKMSDKATAHAQKQYHLFAITKMEEFLTRYENPSQSVDTILENESRKIIEDNQKVLISLFKVVLLCGKQGLALRGHRDDKIDWTSADNSCSNEGNFIQLLRFRAETDPVLADHLAGAPRNAKYTSKTIQNELIAVIGNTIQNDILDEIRKAKLYTVIADEVTDTANKEVLSLCLRYIFDSQIKEVFVDFLEVERITSNIAILKWLQTKGLALVNLRGQCYDGASNMSGARSGCKSIVQQEAHKAIYVHCASHRLNLAVVSACKIQAFKNAESCIGEISRLFNYSPKRQSLLDKAIDTCNSSSKVKKLKDACRTRWIERIDSYAIFLELLPAVIMSLQAIVHPSLHIELGTDWSWDGETISKANGFLYQLESSTFLITFQILLQVLHILRELTMKLQMQAMDVLHAYKSVDHIVSTLKALRKESVNEFKSIFTETTQLGKHLHGDSYELSTPRLAGRQLHRSNPSVSTPEEYFRITLYDEFLSHVIAELEDRFTGNAAYNVVHGLLYLLPCKCITLEDGCFPTELKDVLDFYDSDLPHPQLLPIEYRLWVLKWKQHQSDLPTKLLDVFQSCSQLQFPNIHILIQIALTIPITSCESERSFSQLKLVKTSLRSTMTESRLSGLALMKINYQKCNELSQSQAKLKKLVDFFAQLHPRRIKLPFMLSD